MVKPRILSLPPGRRSYKLADDAVDLAKHAGLELDEWQAYVLRESLATVKGSKWRAFEVGLNVPRQNGKSAVLEARILAEVFLVRSEYTIYSAHLYDTSMEIFRRVWSLIEETPDLLAQVKPTRGKREPQRSHGFEGIEFSGDRRVRFRTRTKSAGRGFSCDCLLLDEAMFLPEITVSALMPTMRARKNPQLWYSGSAVDQLEQDHGISFARIRERGERGDSDLSYFEWSVEGDNPSAVPPAVLEDRAAWAQANPAMGIRIDQEHMEREYRSMGAGRGFAVELLGIGDWPRTDHLSTAIDLELWNECEDRYSTVLDPVCMAVDVSPDRFASVSAAGRREDGLWHIECLASRRGTAWVPEYLAERVKRNRPAMVVCEGYGPVASLVSALEKLNVEVTLMTSAEHAQACGKLVDAIEEGNVRYPTSPELHSAVRAAKTRPLGDAWAWSRKHSSANISPLVSVTLALSAAMTTKPAKAVFAWA